ncbi:MAG: YicC/YloC family endoribonuclease [Planctomycetota bacterium]
MIRSMTGYGEASAHIDGTHYFLQVRTLNGKYFKATVRLQDDFEALEAELESGLRKRIARGTAAIKATCTDETGDAAQEINLKAFDRYVEQLEQSASVASGVVKLDVGALLSLPGVLQPPSDEGERVAKVREVFRGLLSEATDKLIAMRTSEGELLAEDLRKQMGVISAQLAIVRERAPQVVQDYEQRLKGRIEQYVREAGATAEPADVIREVASYAERTDIAEEIQRLGGHVEQFLGMIGSGEDKPVGRTLDFMAQEMLREANTMSSKSFDTDISRAIVEIKGAIDRVKEQVQNVE